MKRRILNSTKWAGYSIYVRKHRDGDDEKFICRICGDMIQHGEEYVCASGRSKAHVSCVDKAREEANVRE